MDTKETPIFKLNDGNRDYYPLTVSSAVALDQPIVVKTAVGGFAVGDVITVTTTIYQILCKLFGTTKKTYKYDKITIKTNKAGEMYVNRDALFKLDDLTITEDANKTLSVDVQALVDNNMLVIKDHKITLDLSKLIDNESLKLGKDGLLYANGDKFIRVDNEGIIKDSHNRISFNRKAIRIDGKYLYRDKHDRICFDDKYLNNYDPKFIIKDNASQLVTLNTATIDTIDDDQVIKGIKTFSNGINISKSIKFNNGTIREDQDGIVIEGLKDSNEDNSAVTKKYLLNKLADNSTYLTIPLFNALGLKSAYEVQVNVKKIDRRILNLDCGQRYAVDVPDGNVEVLKLRSSQSKDNMNVIIDWGDGYTVRVKDLPVMDEDQIGTTKDGIFFKKANTDNEIVYFITHVYPEVDAKYTVSIYGNSYWGLHHDEKYPNLLCRIFDSDLPICNCVKSLSDIAIGALRLQNIDLPAYYDFSEVQNFSGAFKNCLNLKRVNGFKKYIFADNVRYASSVFEGCKYLLYCDWHLAGSAEDWSKSNSNFFDGCEALKSDLVEMLPSGGFSRKVVSMKDTFKGCKSLLCNDWNYVGSILWNDSSTIWKNTENCFKDCDDNFRKHIPESWGGLKKVIYHDDVIVIRNMDEIYNLVSKLASSCGLNMSLNNDIDLFNIIKEVAKQNDIEIKLDNDSQLVKSIETVVVSLGARQLVTLF